MKTQLLSAAADCDTIARYPLSGIAFQRLRKSLKLVEGCCRQAAHWRQDARWLTPGMQMERAHQIARGWLHRPSVQAKRLFTKLGEALRQIHRDLVRLETMATGRVGIILDHHGVPQPLSQLEHRPTLPGGLIAPQRVQ